MPEESARKPERKGGLSRRTIIKWSALSFIVLALALFVGCVVVPAWKARGIVAEYAADQSDETSPKEIIARLGGAQSASWKLRVYLRLPRKWAPHRSTAAYLLGGCGPETVPYLMELLAEAEDRDVLGSGRRLYEVGPEVGSLGVALWAGFAELEGLACMGAIAALSELGPEAVPALVEALDDERASVRYFATWTLGNIGAEARPAAPAMVGNLRDSDKNVRRITAWALGQVGTKSPQAAAGMAGLLADPDIQVRLAAAMGLEGLGPDAAGAVPALIKALKDKDSDVRKRAVRALGAVGPAAAEAAPALVEALREAEADVRVEAEFALGRIGPRAVPPLVEALRGKNPPKLTVTGVIVEVAQRRRAPFDADHALSGERFIYEPGKGGYSLLLYLRLPKKLAPHKREAARVIPWLSALDTDALLRALADPDAGVRRRVTWALGKIGERDARGAQQSVSFTQAQGRYVTTTSRMPPEAAEVPGVVPALAKLLGDADPSVRLEAARALGRFGKAAKKAAPALVEAAAGKDLLVRLAAASALTKVASDDAGASRAVARVRAEVIEGGVKGMVRIIQTAWKRGNISGPGNLASDAPDTRELLAAVDPAAVYYCSAADVGDHYEVANSMDLGNLYGGRRECVTKEGAKLLRKQGHVDLRPFLLVALPGHPREAYICVQMRAPFMDGWEDYLKKGLEAFPAKEDRKLWTAVICEVAGAAGPRALPILTGKLDDGRPAVRALAAGALGCVRPVEGDLVEVLRKLLRDADAGVRRAAVESLGCIGKPAAKALPDVLGLAGDKSRRVRQAVAGALLKLGPESAEALSAVVGLLGDGDYSVSRRASEALGGKGPAAAGAVRELIALLGSKRPRARRLAARALGKIGRDPARVVPALQAALGDAEVGVRLGAVRALGKFGPAAAGAADAVYALALKDRKLVGWCALTLAAAGDPGPQRVAKLAELLASKEVRDGDKVAMLRGFRDMGPRAKAALPAIKRFLKEGHKNNHFIKERTIEALEKIEGKKFRPEKKKTAADEVTISIHVQPFDCP